MLSSLHSPVSNHTLPLILTSSTPHNHRANEVSSAYGSTCGSAAFSAASMDGNRSTRHHQRPELNLQSHSTPSFNESSALPDIDVTSPLRCLPSGQAMPTDISWWASTQLVLGSAQLSYVPGHTSSSTTTMHIDLPAAAPTQSISIFKQSDSEPTSTSTYSSSALSGPDHPQLCRHAGCINRALLSTSRKRLFCKTHMRIHGLTPSASNCNICVEPGCPKYRQSCMEGKKYCARHARQHGWSRLVAKCKQAGCGKAVCPSEEMGNMYCIAHTRMNGLSVKQYTCLAEGCSKQVVSRFKGGRRKYCGEHVYLYDLELWGDQQEELGGLPPDDSSSGPPRKQPRAAEPLQEWQADCFRGDDSSGGGMMRWEADASEGPDLHALPMEVKGAGTGRLAVASSDCQVRDQVDAAFDGCVAGGDLTSMAVQHRPSAGLGQQEDMPFSFSAHPGTSTAAAASVVPDQADGMLPFHVWQHQHQQGDPRLQLYTQPLWQQQPQHQQQFQQPLQQQQQQQQQQQFQQPHPQLQLQALQLQAPQKLCYPQQQQHQQHAAPASPVLGSTPDTSLHPAFFQTPPATGVAGSPGSYSGTSHQAAMHYPVLHWARPAARTTDSPPPSNSATDSMFQLQPAHAMSSAQPHAQAMHGAAAAMAAVTDTASSASLNQTALLCRHPGCCLAAQPSSDNQKLYCRVHQADRGLAPKACTGTICKEPGCAKYAQRFEQGKIFCVQHAKQRGWTRAAKSVTMCHEEGCGKQACPSEGVGCAYCATHMRVYGLVAKKYSCQQAGCQNQAVSALKGGRRRYCSDHLSHSYMC